MFSCSVLYSSEEIRIGLRALYNFVKTNRWFSLKVSTYQCVCQRTLGAGKGLLPFDAQNAFPPGRETRGHEPYHGVAPDEGLD